MNTADRSRQNSSSAVAFGGIGSEVTDLADDEFLRAVSWRKSAEPELVQASRSGDVAAFCALWAKSLPAGFSPSKSSKKRDSAHVGLAAPDYVASLKAGPLQELLRNVEADNATGKNGRRSVARWELSADDQSALAKYLDGASKQATSLSPADLLGLTELLLRSSGTLECPVLFSLWRTTLTAACSMVDEPSAADGDPAQAADAQLVQGGELPWRVGLLFAEVKGAAKMRRSGRKVIRRELSNLTDGDGTPHAKLLPRLGYWLASLIRSGQWGNAFGAAVWDDDSSVRFNDLLEQAIRLYRPSGSWALSNGFTASPQSLFQAASRLAGSDFKIADLSFAWDGERARNDGKKTKSKKDGASARLRRQKKFSPSSQSDWADLACLRSDWDAECNSIVVDYSGQFPKLDMTVLGRRLFQGRWDLQVQVDGKPVEIKSQWMATCWNSDSDGDYLELQQTFDSGARVERQVWLSRTLHYAMFADSLSGFGGERLEYTARLPLVEGVDAQSDGSDRETRLKDGPVLSRVFPLFLPQDRVYSTPGGCGVFANDLVIKHVAAGQGLYAPVVLDWHSSRRRKPVQWRQLTVTEDGQILPGAAAAGFRVKVGEHHLLAYRRLQAAEYPHSVLGYQTLDETVLGHFDKDGDVTPLLLVE